MTCRRLTPEEGYALREAHAKVVAAPRKDGEQPTLPDLIIKPDIVAPGHHLVSDA